MNISIVTDSTCDLPEEIVNQQAITVVPMYINVNEKSYLDGVDLTRDEFYANLPGYFPAPKTATPSIETFIQTYERLAEEGAQAILSIHLSETLSATVNSARAAAERCGPGDTGRADRLKRCSEGIPGGRTLQRPDAHRRAAFCGYQRDIV